MQAHVDKSIHLAFMLLFVHIILFNKLSILKFESHADTSRHGGKCYDYGHGGSCK
jgi:hypothetical protein